MRHLAELLERYPALGVCRADIEAAHQALTASWSAGGKLLVCGNGGSAADADHIVGELMKGFLSLRPLDEKVRARLRAVDAQLGAELAGKLQKALPVINLAAPTALSTAFANDVSGEMGFAQAALGYGRAGDVLMGISTSGNAANVRAALVVARANGLATIGLTGRSGGKMAGLCDVLIRVPADRTFEVQELHLPVYHCLCAMAEAHFFAGHGTP